MLPLPQCVKLNRLFAFYHSRTEPELSNLAVATMLGQRVGRQVDPVEIEKARSGAEDLAGDLLAPMCDLFGVDRTYLIPKAGGDDRPIDARLHMWTLARDLGLHHLAARADHHDSSIVEGVVKELQQMARNEQAPSDLQDHSSLL